MKRIVLFSSVLAMFVVQSNADVIFTHPAPDPYTIYQSDDKLLNAEAKSYNSNWEIGVGITNTGGITGANIVWQNGQEYDFSLVQTGTTVVFSVVDVNGSVKSSTKTGILPVNDLFVEAKSYYNSEFAGEITISDLSYNSIVWQESGVNGDLSVNGGPDAPGDSSYAVFDILRITDDTQTLSSLSGKIAFSWVAGETPKDARTEMIIKGFYNETDVPEAGALSMIAAGLIAIVGSVGLSRRKTTRK